jgi:hypothetical protein
MTDTEREMIIKAAEPIMIKQFNKVYNQAIDDAIELIKANCVFGAIPGIVAEDLLNKLKSNGNDRNQKAI